ncbi:MAG: nickel pincer cofactor biosynthesis protein LarC [Bacteroidota bacterium]|nr:nickel pincer cofactor biosynthesis protein LarC [Bacteroidota bacterium]
MKILYYDCFSGISGDMNLAAMVDLGVDPTYLLNELKKLKVDGYSISFVPDQRKGISGTRADILIEEEHSHAHGHTHSPPHSFQFSGKLPVFQKEAHGHHHSHHERNFATIRNLIQNSELSNFVKKLSIDIFKRIAEAEGKIHGKPLDEVHFHEVGAVDSIVDIVGAAICIDFLKPDKIIASPLELGGGTVKCAHGVFPVPAPATLEILKDVPVKLGAVPVETTTPTGAAIIKVLADEFTEKPVFKLTKIAYGIGHRDNAIPNVLRVCLAEPNNVEVSGFETAVATIVECNIDDMNPETYEYVMEKLFEAGADDVYFQSIIMKKTRPAVKISVLCSNELASTVENLLLTQTSTLGVRKYEVRKTMLKRIWVTVGTKWGEVRVKQGTLDGEVIKSKPEYEDCLKISRENNVSLSVVYKEIAGLLNQLK